MGRGQRIDTGPRVPRRAPVRLSDLLPAEHSDYLAAIDAKHFDASTAAGSVFSQPASLRDLLVAAAAQPGGLGRDDRDLFTREGVPAAALLNDCRYLRVAARGHMGLVDAHDLPDDEPVRVVRHKPGVPCSLTVRRAFGAEVDYATVIVGPNTHERASTALMVWTAHPGPPVQPASDDLWAEGSVISAATARLRLGPGPVWLQARA